MAMGLGFMTLAHAEGTKVWDAQQFGTQPGDYVSGVDVTGNTTLNGGNAVRLRFNGIWAQAGQSFGTGANWTNYQGASFMVRNDSNRPVSLAFKVENGNGNSRGIFFLRAGQTSRFYVDFTTWRAQNPFMKMPLPALDSHYRHIFATTPFTLSNITKWQFFSRDEGQTDVTVSDLFLHTGNAGNTPQVDGYGQLTDRDWDLKVISPTIFNQVTADENADLLSNPGTGETQGSLGLVRLSPTGKWRAVKSPKGKAYFVTPQGRWFWSLGATSVVEVPQGGATIISGRENMFTNLPGAGDPEAQFYGTRVKSGQTLQTFNFYGANLYRKYGANWINDWEANSNRRLRSWGFNTLGSGSRVFTNNPMPFTITRTTDEFPVRLAIPVYHHRNLPDPYASNFQSWIVQNWSNDIPWYSQNPNFIGLYVDGEQTWGLRSGTTREVYQTPLTAMLQTASQPAKVGMVQLLMSRYRNNINTWNTAWGQNFNSWAKVSATPITLTDERLSNATVRADLSAMLTAYVQTYYRKVRGGLTTIGLNGLLLGSKDGVFASPDEVFTAQVPFVDTISVTYYARAEDVPWTLFNAMRKPVLLSEFSFMGQDRNSPSGSFQPEIDMPNQTARAQAAEGFMQTALQQPNIIGAHWFTYVDQPLTGRAADGENFQFGLVDITDRPYQEMVDAFRRVTRTMYAQRGL
jgi:hypothetical protein